MPKGSSGRIVIEVEPDFKDELYTVLEKEGLNMKSWFVANAQFFLKNRSQMSLGFVQEEEPDYKRGGKNKNNETT
ncbi:MAG: hypothetical protein QGF64_05690 [Candidatus Poseidoniia archaeon]|jgi:hypothetical protein|nr:hypothetical protein [Candidatus Poseidoniia archaeon]|tara:strand:+ start:177 stop:401 length:225 start_codon:yes stop_codon:yes gene_type:complete